MGATLSTFILLMGSLGTGILASISADSARKKQWKKTQIFSGVGAGVALLLVIMNLFMIIKHPLFNLSGPGVMIAMIFLILSMIGVIVLDTFSFAGSLSSKPEETRAYGMSVGSAILSFGSFIVALVIIIFLL